MPEIHIIMGNTEKELEKSKQRWKQDNCVQMDGWMDGWMTCLFFNIISVIARLYEGDYEKKSNVQLNSVYN